MCAWCRTADRDSNRTKLRLGDPRRSETLIQNPTVCSCACRDLLLFRGAIAGRALDRSVAVMPRPIKLEYRFGLPDWALAATVALRRLEDRLNLERPTGSASDLPSLLICIPWREAAVEPMYRHPWRLETDAKADYLIATERMNCAENQPVVLIDEVKRFDRPFALGTFARRRDAMMPLGAPAPR